MKGFIFNIQKFCLHDGPGIRTTVFFKGCNLHCIWCANPESQNMCIQMTLDGEKCLNCGACVEACPSGARSVGNDHPLYRHFACAACGECMQHCPVHAIGVEGREMDIQAVLDEVMKDEAFYRRSGGGVTFSGGEVLLQHEFAAALARELHKRNVNVAIETAAAVPDEIFRAFLKEIDYAFIDLKHYNSTAHKKGTGIGNEQIIANIASVQKSGLPFMVRIPVIPGYNDDLQDAEGFAKLLLQMDIHCVQLLPFHQMGERKYSLLGRKYDLSGIPQLHGEDLQEYKQVFERFSIKTEL